MLRAEWGLENCPGWSWFPHSASNFTLIVPGGKFVAPCAQLYNINPSCTCSRHTCRRCLHMPYHITLRQAQLRVQGVLHAALSRPEPLTCLLLLEAQACKHMVADVLCCCTPLLPFKFACSCHPCWHSLNLPDHLSQGRAQLQVQGVLQVRLPAFCR
jgi:hypothetical protein